MNYLSRFDYIIIFSILFCALIFELYHKNTIVNLNNVQKDKFKQQHSLIITPKSYQESFDFSQLFGKRINVFYKLFQKNLLDKKYFMKYHYYYNKELDTNVYFRIEIKDRTIYLNFFSNSYNQDQSFLLAKKIKEYVSNDIFNLIYNDLDKLNNFIKEDRGLVKFIDANLYYETIYFSKTIEKTYLEISEILETSDNNDLYVYHLPYNLIFFILLIIYFIILKKIYYHE